VAAALFFVLTALPSEESMSISSAPPDSEMQWAERLVTVPYIALLGPIGFAAPFLVGLWAGRRRILEQVEQHHRLLTAVAAVGIPAAVLGAQPVALMLARVIDRPGSTTLSYLGPLHDATGVLGGAGYAAAIALLSIRLTRPGRVTQALAATGQRSMTCYLCQSPMWALLFSSYLLDLSGVLSVAATAALATTTWVGTVLLADWMRRTGRRGPFERLVRRVTYGGLRRQGAEGRPDDLRGSGKA
jgi:uncharacterized membrane protein YeiB